MTTTAFADLGGYYPAWIDYRRWFLRIPGVQAAVRQGTDMLSLTSGVADESTGSPMRPAHLFRIASHSKTFTAVTVLQLAEQGALRLDDRVGAHVPELAASPVADRTVRDLLSHGGGVIRDSTDGDFWQLHRAFPDRAELIRIATDPTAAVLGRTEHFKYSNIAYGLLGLVVEAVTGAGFAERVRTAVIEPLGLADTGVEYDPARAGDYAAGHSALSTGRDRRVIGHVDTRALAAATGCYATAADLTAFFAALLPGDTRLLGADAQREQRHPVWQIKPNERSYGLGVFLDTVAGANLFGHTGGYPGHITCTLADAERGWVVSVLTNAVDGAASELATGWFRLLELGSKADHAECGERGVRFTGRFAALWGPLDVVRLDGRLFALGPVAGNPAEEAVPLEVVDDRTLRIVGGRGGNSYGELMTYDFGDDGSVRSMRGDSGVSHTPFAVPDGD